MKYYLIAGEASGDLHAANLMKALRARDAGAEFRFWGGDCMLAQGGKLVRHYRDLAFMGFWEVLINIFTILSNFRFCKKDILAFNPDAVILVDYPGFNLRMARYASRKGFRVFYYISPQVWAWKQSRVHLIKKYVDRLFVILPFEKEFYSNYGYEVDFVGHPLLDNLPQNEPHHDLNKRPVIAVVPGSRTQEVSKMLPVMMAIRDQYPGYQFIVSGVSTIDRFVYERFSGENSGVEIVYDNLNAVLQKAHAALVTSGTATLQAALLNVPLVVCYKGSYFSYLIARLLIKASFISLVNLIAGEEVVKELIQGEFNKERLKKELDNALDVGQRKRILDGYAAMRAKLGDSGASAKTAGLMLEYMK